MPQKTLNLLAALAGLLIIAAIALLGYDVYRAARTGPRWKRRLVSAGLALLALVGPVACGSAADSTPPVRTVPADRARRYDETAEWRQLLAIWKEAGGVAAGKRGAYPFDRAGKKRVLESLVAATQNLDALKGARLLSEAEVCLLKEDLAQLTRGVQAKRPTEMRMATCYEPMMMSPARDSLKRLAARLPFLSDLAGSGRLRPEVVRKVLVSVEKDLGTLSDERMLRPLSDAEKAQAATVRESIKEQVAKLKAALGGASGPTGARGPAGASLVATPKWKTVTDAWKTVAPLARSGVSTTSQRKDADTKMGDARKAIAALKEGGLLAAQEAELLTGELANLRQDMYRNPPTDSRVTCYDMAYISPAQISLDRIAKRLPLIEKLAAGGKLHPAAASKIIAAAQADLAILADEKKLAKLPAAEQRKARKAQQQAADLLEKLRRRLPQH